jgi:two-component system sensor histidine kinase MtrB
MLLYRRGAGRRQQRVRLEQELEKQKVIGRTKDEAIANLSHELRTPLTSIYGFAMTMLEQPIAAEPELATEMARLIASESAELGRMVDDLLTAAKSDNKDLVFRTETVDPAVEVDKVLAPFATNNEIHTQPAEGRITADRLRLRQVLRNLLSNAIKHGGTPVAIIGRIENGRYVFDVVDHGPGVAPELKDRIFQRYVHQGRSPLLTGSVGLGLSIAHLLTTGMGGTIGYRRSGELTIFELRFPLASQSEENISSDQLSPLAVGI